MNASTPMPAQAHKRQRPEEKLQATVCKFLTLTLDQTSMFFSVPNGGLRSRTEAIRFKATGVVAGMPDICVVNNGRLIGLELKAPKGRVSDAQLYCHERLRAAQVPVTVCRSLDDVIGALLAAGVPLKRAMVI